MGNTKFFSLALLVVGLSFFMVGAAVLGGLDLAQAQSTTGGAPSFEVATSSQPVLTGQGVSLSPSQVDQNEVVRISVQAYDVSGLASAVAYIRNSTPGSRPIADVPLYDDGQHSDGASGDGIFSGTWNSGSNTDGLYPVEVKVADRLNNTATMNVVTIALGVGACATDSDCTATGNSCCSGICAADQCVSNSECNDSNAGTSDTCVSSSCPSYCSNTPITQCLNNDGFCPASCTSATDNDCADSTAPAVSVTTPGADGTTLATSPVQIIARATDSESGIGRVEFYLDSEATPRDSQVFDSPVGSGNYIWVMNLAGVTNGTHTITAKAFNGVALSSTATRSVQVTISSSAPFSVAITSPLAGSTYASGSSFNVTVAAQDDLSVTEVRVFSAAGGSAVGSVASAGTSVTVNVPVTAGMIAAAYDPLWSIAQAETVHKPFPFISVANAATGDTCTTTTNSYPKSIYAVAYDAQGQYTPSGLLSVIVTTTTTSCTNSNSATSTTTSPGL